jgi:hypothetical protein
MFLLPEIEPQPGASIPLLRLQFLAVEFLDIGSSFVCHVGLMLDPSLLFFPFLLSAV